MNDPYLLLQRAEVLMNLRRYADAKKTLAECLQIVPDFAPAHSMLAQCLYHESKNEHREEALREAELAVSLAPEWAYGYYILAWLESNFGNHRKAIRMIDTAIERMPENAWFHFQRGGICFALGKYADARKSFHQCLELDPEHHGALCALSDTERVTGHHKLAVSYADKAVLLAPENSGGFAVRGLAASASWAYKEADDLLREAVRLDPESEYAKTSWKAVRETKRDIRAILVLAVFIASVMCFALLVNWMGFFNE